MKIAKLFLFFILILIAACNGNSVLQEFIIVNPSLQLGPNAQVLNEEISGREMIVLDSPGEGKMAVLKDLVIVDPVDTKGLEAFLDKYQAKVVEDPAIPLPPGHILDENGLQETPSNEKIVAINLEIAGEGNFADLATETNLAIPVIVSSESGKAFLNLTAQMVREDSQKIRGLRPVLYALELPQPSALKNLGLENADWATCECLRRDPEPPNELISAFGATWYGEEKITPIYNSLIDDPLKDLHCAHHNGALNGNTTLLQGENVLIGKFWTIYDNTEVNDKVFFGLIPFQAGPVGRIHLWAFPSSALPFKLPSQLDGALPVGGSSLEMKGPADGCEWWDPPDEVVLFLWEGDECISLIFFSLCNPDDPLAEFLFNRSLTTGSKGLLLMDVGVSGSGLTVSDLSEPRTVDLRVSSIDFCRNNGPVIQETCNGYDDTCDGQVDEGFGKGEPCDNGGVGQCASTGVLICSSARDQDNGADPLVCNAIEKVPSPFEICDGVDNDCDGAVDEDWLQNGLACGLSVGTCGVGALGCSEGVISCEGEIIPTSEIWDGLDNDCDGVSDEGCTCSPGSQRECSINLGPCVKGIQECETNGTWSPLCSGIVPQVEVCDGVDNNCNGAVDEGVLNRCGECGPEPIEVCDGLDNDCDGEVDEGVTNICGGCWEVGPEEWISGDAACDGIDNDCDGAIDERDSPLYCGVGVCARDSVSVCIPCDPGDPLGNKEDFNTTCNNGLDDDCDGYTDTEDFPDCVRLQGGGG